MTAASSTLLAANGPEGYGPILILIAVAAFLSTAIIVITHVLPKAKRHGREKESTYESGMPVLGDARRRFNVRFYLVAVLFLLFDVDIVLVYPWVLSFFKAKEQVGSATDAVGASGNVAFLVAAMAIFGALLLIGFIYDWGKGILRYD